MFESEPSPFESNLFKFKSKNANRIASYCLLGGLCFGFLLGIVLLLCGGRWFRSIAFCTTAFGLIGLVIGFAVGTKIDKDRKKEKKG
jgi:membrane associated rhomboid family serine protease